MSVENFVRRNAALRAALAGPRAIRREWVRARRAPVDAMLSRLSEWSVSDIVIRVDEYDGEFEVSPKSHLVHRLLEFGSYEPVLSKITLDSIDPDRDVIDVGANVGFYTVAAAKRLRKGKVLAFEPTDGAFRRLKANVERNGVADKVILFKGVALESSRETTLNFIEDMEEYSSVGHLVHQAASGKNLRQKEVPGSSVDDLVAKYDLDPGLMKVDTEGAEHLVFAGSQYTMANFKPIIFAEYSARLLKEAGGDADDLIAMFRGHGYEISDPVDPKASLGVRDIGDIMCVPSRSN